LGCTEQALNLALALSIVILFKVDLAIATSQFVALARFRFENNLSPYRVQKPKETFQYNYAKTQLDSS